MAYTTTIQTSLTQLTPSATLPAAAHTQPRGVGVLLLGCSATYCSVTYCAAALQPRRPKHRRSKHRPNTFPYNCEATQSLCGILRKKNMVTVETPAAPAAAKLDPRNNIAIWVLLTAAFVVILNETVMGVALPVLLDELQITASQGQWLTTAFLLTMSVTIPITGALIQRMTTRKLFFTAMSLFLTGTLIAATAPGFLLLLLGRIVQAVGTAITMPLLMTTVITVVPPQIRGRVMGRVSLVIAVAPALGPTISGVILEHLPWRFLFILILPVISVATLIAFKFLPNLGQPRRAPLDGYSILLSVVGFGSLVYGLSAFGEARDGSLLVPLLVVVLGVLGVVLFVWRQVALIRHEKPLLDLRVFTFRPYRFGSILLAFCMMAMFGTIVLLPLYTANVLHMTTLQIGLLLLPGGLIMGLMGPVAGRLVDKHGARTVLLPGIIITAAALWMFTLFGVATPYWYVQAAHLLFSIGLTGIFTPVFSTALGSLPPHLASHGSATISTLQQVSGALGIALFVAIYGVVAQLSGGATAAAQASGMQAAFVTAAVLLTLVIPLTFLMPKRPLAQQHAAVDATNADPSVVDANAAPDAANA